MISAFRFLDMERANVYADPAHIAAIVPIAGLSAVFLAGVAEPIYSRESPAALAARLSGHPNRRCAFTDETGWRCGCVGVQDVDTAPDAPWYCNNHAIERVGGVDKNNGENRVR